MATRSDPACGFDEVIFSEQSAAKLTAGQFPSNADFSLKITHSQKKQIRLLRRQLFISIRKAFYKQIPERLVPDVLFNKFDFCLVFLSR
jgi:hypothetical protein